MKQIIWKELREWYKWGIGFGVLWFLASLTVETKVYNFSPPVLFFFRSTTLTLHIIAVSAAAILGYLQFHREKTFDQRAFLFHRPLSHSKIFWSKAMAGLIIYMVIVSAFLLRSVIEKHHSAQPFPFEWSMLVPGILILLNGIPAYFAGTVVANRESSWFGSKLLPLLLICVNCLYLLEGRGNFGTAFIVITIISIIMATHALEAHLSLSGHSLRLGLGKFAGSTTLSVANIVLCILVLFILAIIFETRRHDGDLTQERFAYELYRDGEIYKTRYVNNSPVDAISMDGTPYTPKTKADGEAPSLLNDIARLQWVYLGGGMDSLPPIQTSKRFFDLVYADDTSLVYYVKSKRRILMYSRTTRDLLGSYGPEGWQKGALASAAKYPDSFKFIEWKNYMSRSTRKDLGGFMSDDELSLVVVKTNSNQDKEITLQPLSAEPIRGIIRSNMPLRSVTDDQVSNGSSTIITTDQEIVILSHEGKILARLDMSAIEDHSKVLVSQLDDLKRFVFFITHGSNSITPTLPEHAPTQMVTFDMETGSKISEISLPAMEDNPPQQPQPSINAYYGIVTPPIALIGSNLSLGRSSTDDLTPQYLLLLSAASLAAALMGIFLSRRYQLSMMETVVWIPASLLLSWPGPLTMLCLCYWPLRTACPTCNKQRSIQKDKCEHCETDFPEPAMNGTEIFESA
jgi:hypothetical protein